MKDRLKRESKMIIDMKGEIKKLAQIEEGPFPFLSIYLNTKWDDEQQRERIRLFIKNELKKAYHQVKGNEDWERAFLEDQKLIERYVEGLVRQHYEEGVNGFAIFSSGGSKTFLTYPSIIPFENEFFLSDLPVLRPLVKLSSQYQNTLAVMVDTDSARLFEISLEGEVIESSIESYVPGRHDQGGWAQMRYQRHIHDHMDKHHKEVSEQLIELFDSGKWKRIVLIGQSRIIANFKSFLPERIKENITDTFSMNFSEGRSKVLKRIFERLLQIEREEIRHEVQELKEKKLTSGLATFGLNGTLEAVNKGQVQTLYIHNQLSLSGGKCTQCKSLTLLSPLNNPKISCPFCRGDVKNINLEEEMMRYVLRQDGDVKWIEEDSFLKEHEGICALLRFR